MQYGICNLSIIPLRSEPADRSGMVNQILYGEFFEILEEKQGWAKIRSAFDSYEGWVDSKQYLLIPAEVFRRLKEEDPVYTADLVEFITDEKESLIPISLGSTLNYIPDLDHHYDGSHISGRKPKNALIESAYLYLNAPYLWGGKTPFGIDCSGFTQMVYRLNGYQLHRDSAQQATQGESLSFIEESEPGDLAFFDNKDGVINHVGIMMSDNYIIHAHGKVRIDRIDHSGIYNPDLRKHTHQLRVIKKII